MPELRVNGVEIDYDDRGSGPPLVLVHGFGGHKGTWDEVTPELSKHHRVVTMSHRGIAGSSEPADGDHSVQAMADDVHGLLESLAVDRPVLLGHSLGGFITQVYYLTYPDECSGLILYGTLSDSSKASGEGTWGADVVDTIERDGLRPYVNEMMDFWLSPEAPPQSREQLMDSALLTPDRVAAAIWREIPKHDLSDKMQEIRVPTLFMVGDGDRRTPVAESERMNGQVPDSWLKIVKGVAHYVHIERPDEFTRAVLGFMRMLD